MRRQVQTTAMVADVVAVVLFAGVGRSTHDESVDVSGVAHTAWPFLVGTAIALVITGLTRTDPTRLGSGVRVWVWTVVIGMVIRAATLGTFSVPFIIVATVVLGVLLLGWRTALRLIRS